MNFEKVADPNYVKLADIKETKEAVQAISQIALSAIWALKDGAQISDLSVLFENMTTIQAAFDDMNKIPGELKDLDRDEIVELSAIGINMVFDILAMLKAEKPQESPQTA